jgi:leucyl-tRNA synthetase
MEEKQFNTAVARLMELMNALNSFEAHNDEDRSLLREGVEILLKCLSPFSPHICEELWQMLGNTRILALSDWPVVDEKALVVDSRTIVVQVNGKLRARLEVPSGISEAEQKQLALSDERISSRIEGKEIMKVIVVPERLVNVVVKG